MKTVYLATVLYFFSCIINASTNEQTRDMGIRVNIVSTLLGVADVEYDLKVHKNFSLALALDAGVIYLASVLANDIQKGLSFGGGIGGQWNISSAAFENGWYVKPMVRFAYSGLIATKNNLLLIPSVGAGYEWFWASGLSLNAGIDTYLPISLSKIPERNSNLYFSFPIPLATVGIGYAW